MADRNWWDHDGARQGRWRYSRFHWKLDAHHTTDTICILMAYFLILEDIPLRMEPGWKVLPRRKGHQVGVDLSTVEPLLSHTPDSS